VEFNFQLDPLSIAPKYTLAGGAIQGMQSRGWSRGAHHSTTVSGSTLGCCDSLLTSMKKLNLLISSLLIAATSLSAQQLGTKKSLNLAVTKVIVAAAEREAAKNNWTMFITVVDDGGTVVAIERMDETQIGSLDVSIGKAQTALKFKRPSKVFDDLVNSGKPGLLDLGVTPVEGGIPLMADGKVIGAIGVSGGTSQQDAQVAQAGVAALEALLKK